MDTLFKYNRESTLAAVLYILDKVGVADWHLVHKTFYIADKKSIVDYGKSISGNTYIRMTYGPVASELDYLLEALRQKGAHTTYFGKQVTEIVQVEGKNHVRAMVKPKLRFLSGTDIECLDHAIAICGGLDFNQRTSLTNDYAWAQAKKSGVAIRWEDIAIAGGGGQECVDYLDYLKEAETNFLPPA